MTDGQLISKVEQVLEQLRPNLQMDGGDVRLVKFQDGIVYVKFMGACVGCPAAAYTLTFGIEHAIKEQVPEVVQVVVVDEDE